MAVFFVSLALKANNVGSGDSKMILVPVGKFTMGLEALKNSQPLHLVEIDSFYIDKHEVTQNDYRKLMGANPSSTEKRLEIAEKMKDPDYKLTAPFAPMGDNYPVTDVTWYDAARYCNARSKTEGLEPCYDEETWECDFSKNGYRLPTEAEWEYACRAGTDTRYFWGDDESKMSGYANCWSEGAEWHNAYMKWVTDLDDDSEFTWDKPFPVMLPIGQKKPNPWGLYDMLGNALEWCNDWYNHNYYKNSAKKNPQGPQNGEKKVIRGGSYATIGWSGRREAVNPIDKSHSLGFRCVRNAPKDEDVKDDKDKDKDKDKGKKKE